MSKWYTNTPEVKYPNLFFEVSNILQHDLNKYNIEHTKAEIIFLRDNVLKSLNREGIKQENYNQEEHYDILIGTIDNKIDVFYNTNYKVTNDEL